MKVEGIGFINVVVKDLEAAIKFFSDVMGSKWIGPIELPTVGVRCAFDNIGLQLIQPVSSEIPWSKHLIEHGEGIIGASFKVADVDQAVAELKSKGVNIVGRGRPDFLNAAMTDAKDTYFEFELIQYRNMPSVVYAHEQLDRKLPWF